MRYIFVLILLGVLSNSSFSQDKHFSQFYASPIAVNPALTGAFDGKFRVGAIYRDQWRGAADNPFVTFAASMDMRFEIGRKRSFRDAAAGGILFFTDRVGGVDFNTNQMALSGAYHKALDRASTQYLSAGIKFGFTQKNVNYESLTFQDQFNGIDDYSSPTGEELPENNFAYGDMSAGLYYTITPQRQTSFYAGLALHHFNKANASFYSKVDGTKHKIFMKTVGHVGARLPVGENKQLFPRLMVAMQGPHLQFDAGTSFRTALDDFSSMAMHFGIWVRPVKFDTGVNIDAIIAMVGFEYENVLFGLSYDSNINSLANYSKVHGAFELSVVYLGEYENETILCPTF